MPYPKIKCRKATRIAKIIDLKDDLRFFNCNRRVTRLFAKKMNMVTSHTLPVKKSEKYARIKSDATQNKRRKIEINSNDTHKSNEHHDSIEIDVKNKIPESNINNNLEVSQTANNSNIANADLTTEELQLFDSILDMMEEYGVIDTVQRPSTLEDIRDNFIADSTDLRRSLDSLMNLCEPDE